MRRANQSPVLGHVIWLDQSQTSIIRVVTWLEDREQDGDLDTEAAILDVGCGNGVLSIDLFKAGFSNITGQKEYQVLEFTSR